MCPSQYGGRGGDQGTTAVCILATRTTWGLLGNTLSQQFWASRVWHGMCHSCRLTGCLVPAPAIMGETKDRLA